MIQSLIDQGNQHLAYLKQQENKINKPLHQKLITLIGQLGEICKELEDDQDDFMPLSSKHLPNQHHGQQSCISPQSQQYKQAGSQSMITHQNGNSSVSQFQLSPQAYQLQQQSQQQIYQQNIKQTQIQQQKRISQLDQYNIRYKVIDEFEYKQQNSQDRDCPYCHYQLFDKKYKPLDVLVLDCAHYQHEKCLLEFMVKHNCQECPQCLDIKYNNNQRQSTQQYQQSQTIQQQKYKSQLDQWNINYKIVGEQEHYIRGQINQQCPYCPNLLFDKNKMLVVILDCSHCSHEQCLIKILQKNNFQECPLCSQLHKQQILQQQSQYQQKQQQQQVPQQQFYQKNQLDIIGITHKKIKQNDYSQNNKSIDNCSICLDLFFDKQHSEYIIQLECSHYFHTHCIEPCLQGKSLKCPNCKSIQGIQVGDQPDGTMDIEVIPNTCYGFQCQTLQIIYKIYSSKVNNIFIPGTERIAYLPHNKEGCEVVALLQKAFDRKLIFTIGTSVTTGLDNQVIWNGIHHKTSLSGGSQNFGYPDPTYFARVKQELADKGIK